MSEVRDTTLNIGGENREWLDAWSRRDGISLSRAVNELIMRAREEEEQQSVPSESARSKKERQQLFIDTLEKNFYPGKACRLSGVDKTEMKSWLRDPKFGDRYAAAQHAYIEGIEELLLKIGAGLVKGQALPLMAFLNAHHPKHGRVKAEMLARVLIPLVDRFHAIVREKCSEDVSSAVFRAMRSAAEAKLAEFSD